MQASILSCDGIVLDRPIGQPIDILVLSSIRVADDPRSPGLTGRPPAEYTIDGGKEN